MKKFHALFATLFAATSLFAADILEIRPCDAYGNSLKDSAGKHQEAVDYYNQGKPFGSGVDLYFNIRLISREQNALPVTALPRSSFQVQYNPASGVSYEIAQTIPLKIGIVTRAGKTDWAELVDNAVVRTMSKGTTPTRNLFNAVFRYRTQPGDFALPIKLAKDLMGTPVGEDDSATGCIFYPSSPWEVFYYSSDGSVTNEASFTFRTDYRTGGIDYSDTPDQGEYPLNGNYSMRQCGDYVKTVDFKDVLPRPFKADYVWNEVPEGSDAKFQLESAAALSEATTLYVWSQDEGVVKLVNNDALYLDNVETVSMDVPDKDGKPVTKDIQVATVLIQGGQTLGNFAIRGMKEGDETANLVLSSFKGYNWNTVGRVEPTLIEDYLTVPVLCTKPQPPALELTRVNSTETDVTVSPNYAKAISQLRLALKGQTYSNDMTVTLAPVLTAGDTWPTNRYARINLEGTPDGWMNDGLLDVKIEAGKTAATVDVFGMGAKAGITDGTSNYVEFRIVDVQPADAKAFLTGGYDSKTFLRFKPNTPTMTKPEEGFVDTAVSGADYQITVGIEDNWNNIDDRDTCYTLYLATKRSTDKYWGDWTKLGDNYVIATDNGLMYEKNEDGTPNYSKPPKYVFEYSGTIQASVFAVAPNGETTPTRGMSASSLRDNGRVFTVKVSEPAKVNAKFFADKSAKVEKTEYGESGDSKSNCYVKVYLDEAPGTQLYAFLAPRKDSDLVRLAGSCLTNSTTQGISIGGQSKEGGTGTIRFLDGYYDAEGTVIAFDVILCTTPTYNKDKIYSGFVTGDATPSVVVYNVEPYVASVKMSGSTMKKLPEALSTAKDVERVFTFSVNDLSQIDRDAKNAEEGETDSAMRLKYSIYEDCNEDFTEGNATVEDAVIVGNLYNFKTNFVHTFGYVGKARIEISVMDKDMEEGVWTDPVSYGVVVSDRPSIRVESDFGNTFDETAPSQPGGVPLKVVLSERYSKSDLAVKLTVTPPNDAKPGMLLLGGSGVSQTSANTYALTMKAGKTEYPLFVAAADGTAASAAQGFYIKAEVTTAGVVPGFEPEESSFYVLNVEPTVSCVIPGPNGGSFELQGSEGILNTKTNAIPTGIGEASTITWHTSDVTNDFSIFEVKWHSDGRDGTWKNPDGTVVSNGVTYTFTPKFDLAGFYGVTVSATDKDGGITSATWWYEVQSSKTLVTRAHGPFGGSSDALSARYSNAAGIGAGHTYAAKTFAGASRWCITWNCGTETEVDVFAWGYQPGAKDNGALDNSMDVSLDANGNNSTTSKSTEFNPYYSNVLEKCSYFYRWIPINVSDDAVEQTIFQTLAPAHALNNPDGTATVKLPGEKDDAGNYAKTIVEAIFAQEFLKSDNMGDINADGIPDVYVTQAEYAEGFGIVNVGGTLDDGANDLKNLAAFNDDEDYFPAGFAGGALSFVPGPTNNWVSEGRAFTAKLEIRGWGECFNDALANDMPYRKVAGVQPDKNFTDPATDPDSTLTALEWDAYRLLSDADKANWCGRAWSPERPTDPTKADTNGDGLPDGYEYYIWYKATVGWMDGNTHRFLSGRAYNPQNPFAPKTITPKYLAETFDPLGSNVTRDWDTIDTDNDGILDIVEFTLGTNPFDYDTDGDGLPDGYEVFISETDPLKSDSNNNSVPDGAENPDGDAMAVARVYMNVIGVSVNGGVEYYCCPTTTNFAFAVSETATSYNSFMTLATNDTVVTTNKYVTTAEVKVTENGALIGDLKAWALRESPDGKAFRGPEASFMRGTIVTLTDPVDVYDQTLTVPDKCYVAFQYANNIENAGGLARGKKLDNGATIAGTVCYQSAADAPLEVRWLHHQVYEEALGYGFDPRTAWFTSLVDLGDETPAVNTAEYTTMDEFLSMTFFYRTGGIAAGDMVQNLTGTPKKTMVGIWNGNSTHPLKADSDGDGMPDGWEFYLMEGNGLGGVSPGSNYSPLYYFYDSANFSLEKRDNDEDALEWPQEYSGILSAARYGWNPSFPAWRAKKFPTDPWNDDTDGDGMLDGTEGGVVNDLLSAYEKKEAAIVADSFMYNTSGKAGGGLNPLSVDTDLDGLPDQWEMQFAGTYTPASTETVTETTINGNTTSTVERVVYTGAVWNMDGMDGTVPDSHIDYDHDGLDNWQEYMTGAMRCWRYDDASSIWGSHLVAKESWEEMLETADDEFWYEHLVDVGGPDYNPYFVNGYFDAGMAYFSYCGNEWDPAYHCWYMYRDGIDHDLKRDYLIWGKNRWTEKWGTNPAPYDLNAAYPLKYICCDPTRADSDFDGMDDYYELYHGLNPLLGAAGVPDTFGNKEKTTAFDVVFDAYLVPVGYYFDDAGASTQEELPVSALNNWWRNKTADHATVRLPAYKKGSASDGKEGYDFIANPWLNGMAYADPDGDGIRNQEEAILPKVQAASTYHHTDPTPLWMTDTTYTNSLTRKYYRFASLDTDADFSSWTMDSDNPYFEYEGVKYYFEDFPGFTVEPLVLGGYAITFSYSLNLWNVFGGWEFGFEENEGYDSDHDYLSDYEELQGKTKSPSDPQVTDDPLRRQAMWFNGTDAFLQTPVTVVERVPQDSATSEQRQNFLYFTAECWANPAKDWLAKEKEQTVVERAVWVKNSGAADEQLMRRNFFIGIKGGKWIAGYDSTGTGKRDTISVEGGVASNVWTHLAVAYDGEQLYFYVDGHKFISAGALNGIKVQPEHGVNAVAVNAAGEMNQDGGTSTYSANCISLLVGASPVERKGLVYDWAWRYRESTPDDREGLADPTRLSDYGRFYKGYVDEVRIWDGARAEKDIKADYENKVRYTAEMAAKNRDEVYAKWVAGGLRSPASTVELPPQLMYHFSFDHIPGAIASGDVIPVPAGFNTSSNVTDAKAGWSRPADWTERDWASSAVKSTVYADNSWVPWINNTVAHLPRFDLTTLDSVYWSENYAGGTNAAHYGYASFAFPRKAEVASRRVQLRYAGKGLYYDRFRDRDAAEYNASKGTPANNYAFSQNTRWSVVTGYDAMDYLNPLAYAYRFAARDRNLEGDDLLPMGGAYPKRISAAEGGMWDDGTAADAWAQVGKDSDNNGLPDWWEEYARANYCKGWSPKQALDWDTVVTYKGVKMPAYQAYLRDLAAGLVKNGGKVYYDGNYEDTRDLDGDNMPDWWEDMYGIDTQSAADAKADPDNDGLSNYQEYLIAEKYKWYGLNPTLAQSFDYQKETDYFLKLTAEMLAKTPEQYRKQNLAAGMYLGESVADHDFMEDNYEDEIGTDRTKYDPYSDNDEDGWDAFSELRYRNFKQSISARFASHFVGEEEVKDFPIPVVHATLRYNGDDTTAQAASNAAYVVEAYAGNDLTKAPSAVYRFRSGATETRTVDLGKYAARTVHGTMTPGHVLVGANKADLKFCFVQDNDLWSWRVNGVPYKGTYEEMYAAYQLGGTNVVVSKMDSSWSHKLVNLNDKVGGDQANWLQMSVDDQTGKGLFYLDNETAGAFDSVTGDFSLDLSKLAGLYLSGEGIAMEQCFFRLEYTSEIPALQGNMLQISLAAPDSGKLSEGSTTFVAYMDTDGDGAFTPGVDPIGFVKNVEIGWDKVPELVIEMTDKSQAAGQRIGYGTSSNAAERVSIIRTAINGQTGGVKRRIVYRRDPSQFARDYVFEGDYVDGGKFGIDWAYLRKDIEEMAGIGIEDVLSVTYTAVQGTGSLTSIADENLLGTFTMNYTAEQSKPACVWPTAKTDVDVETARPTFAWTATDGYTAFRLQIGTTTNDWFYSSDLLVLPPKDSQGRYVFEAPVYVGTNVTGDAWALANNSNYVWRVAVYNAKFSNTNDATTIWSDAGEFNTAVAEENDFSTLYGSADVSVSYFGPAANGLEEVVVQLYRAADFSGEPAAQMRLTDVNGTVASLTNAQKVCFHGLADGEYYAVAFVDRNGNGQRDKFEIWGYAAQVGKGVEEIWTPVALAVDAANAKIPSVVLFMEDTDANGDGLLDWNQDENLFTTIKTEDDDDEADPDHDDLTNAEEYANGTEPLNADTDGDGMPDGWEVANKLDPLFNDADNCILRDVMAYAVTNAYVATYKNEKYVIRKADKADEIDRLYRTFTLSDGSIVVGAPTEWKAEIAENRTMENVVLIHSAVYDWFGFDVTTARAVGEGTNTVMGANTAPFTAYWKYVTDAKYLPEFGITYQPVSPNFIDSNNNGIDDGWELYVAMARVAPVKSFPVSNEEQIRHAFVHNYDPYDEYSIFKVMVPDEIRPNLVPFTNEEAFRYGFEDADAAYWNYAAADDKMAIVTNVLMRVANKDGKLYAVRPDGSANGEVSETNRLWTTVQLAGGQLVLGAPTDLTVADVNVKDGYLISTNVTLVHSGVYDWYGFDATTARAVSNAVNTAAFTRAWKWNTNKAYLQAFGLSTMPVNLDAIDSSANAVDDGFELYVGFADVAPVKSFPASNIEEIKPAFDYAYDPYDEFYLWRTAGEGGVFAAYPLMAAMPYKNGFAIAEEITTVSNAIAWLGKTLPGDTFAMCGIEAELFVTKAGHYAQVPGTNLLFAVEVAGDPEVGEMLYVTTNANLTTADLVAGQYEMTKATNVVVMHSAAYDFLGWSAGAGTNATVAFSRYWKLVTRNIYLPHFAGAVDEFAQLPFAVSTDCNGNGAGTTCRDDGTFVNTTDGYELFIRYATVKENPKAVFTPELMRCSNGDNIGSYRFDPYSWIVRDEDDTPIDNKDAFDYRLFDFMSAGEAQLDVSSDYDMDGLSNYQEWLAKKDLGLVLDVEDWMTDGETPDYFRVGTNGQYVGEAFNGAEWIENAVRDILSGDYSARSGTRFYKDTGWDVWSTARYSINKSDGLATVTGVSEELMMIIRYYNAVWPGEFQGATQADVLSFFHEKEPGVIRIVAPDGSYSEIQNSDDNKVYNLTLEEGYKRYDANAVSTTEGVINFFGGKTTMQRVIAENKKSITGADIVAPEPKFTLTLKYSGNETIPVFVEAYQVNGSYPEMGEQLTARWNVTPTFKAGIATGIEFSTAVAGVLVQGPAKFVAYIDNDGDNKWSDADTFGMVERNVGFEDAELEITLGTPNAALPVIELGGSNSVVQSVGIVRTAVNGKPLEKPRGVYVAYFPNNVARERLYPSDFVRKNFIGVDKFLAEDFDEEELARIESVEYTVIDGMNRPFGYDTYTNADNKVVTTFKTVYSDLRDKATVNAVSDALVGTGTLSFNVPTGTANTKFWLRYAKDGGAVETVGGTTGIAMPYSADGTVTITLADYIPNLSVGTYAFSVALGNDKYGAPTDEADWCDAVSQYVGPDAVRDAGFTVTVKHPTAQKDLTNAVVVAAYESADLAEPVAWKVVEKFDNKPVKLGGLVEGKDYYLAAWYVRNLGDNRAHEQYRQPYDTWGYVSSLGTNTTCFAARAAEATANAGTAETIWLQDTFFNDNLVIDREEDMTAVTDSSNAPYETDPHADFDDDDLPDDFDNDPVFDTDEQDADDGDDWYGRVMRGDLMAYKDVEMTLVALGSVGIETNWTWYAVTDAAQAAKLADGSIKLQTPATDLTDLATTYAYGKRIGIGRGVTPTAADGVVMATTNATVRLVHAQVFADCGFDTRTVNKEAFLAGEGVNTKPFTRKDKFLVVRYLEAIGVEGIDEEQLLLDLENPLWDLYWNDRYGYDKADTDLDGIVDGWELYTMFGIEGELVNGKHASRLEEFLADPFAKSAGKTLADAKINPFNTVDGLQPSPDGGLQLVEEFDGGYWPTDPWSVDTDGDNVIDAYAYQYHLKHDDAGEDRDGDGLSNYAEYLISKVFKFAELDPDNPKTNGSCVDYFRKVGDLYFGEVFTDHDQVDDQWEQKYETAANRSVYDPSRDDDEDGWSNYAESKAGTHPATAQSVGVDGEILKEFPVPTIAAKVVYRGRNKDSMAGNLVFQAWGNGSVKYTNGLEMTTTPDATWIASAEGTTNVMKYVGANPGKLTTYRLGTGIVKPGSLRFWFRDAQAENAYFRNGVEISTSHGTNPQWYYFVEDVITGNDAGELRLCATNCAPVKVGTVDYATGLVAVDFGCEALQGVVYDSWVNGKGDATDDKSTGIASSCVKIDLARSFVKIEWTPVKVATEGNVATYYLSDATGHVREGLNRFVVFCDSVTEDGMYTPGEPFGFVQGVDVGWQGGAFTVELTETSPIFARVNLKAAAGEIATDREYFQKDNSTVTAIGAEDSDPFCKELNVHIYGEETDGDDEAVETETRLVRVRVVRATVNGQFAYEHTYDDESTKVYDDAHAVVLDKYMDFSARSYLHEGDFLAAGKYDVDWTYGMAEIWKNKRFFDATRVTYLIVLGEGEVGSGSSNAVFRCAVSRVYDTEAARQGGFLKPVVDAKEPGLVYGGKPTFRWTMADMNGNNSYNSYTAFRIQIGSWTSGYLPAPARDAGGWYSWTLEEPLGTLLGESGSYTWKVAMYNAKFKSESDWSAATFWSNAGTLTVDMNNQQPMNDHGFSSIAATVKYTGPWDVLESKTAGICGPVVAASKVIVQAFTTADFAGDPAGAAYVEDLEDVATPENVAANAEVKGLPQTGTYYLRAFIDSNGNGKKDDWESWGAAKEPVTISPATVTRPTVGIWIEDADTDGDWLPDAWEYVKYGNLTSQSAKIIDEDEIVFSGTVDASGKAGISTGLSGASLTIFQNQSFIKTMVGLTDVVSIGDVRKAVEKKVSPDTVKITALTIAPDGSSVTLSVAAEVTDSIAGEILGQLYNITSGDTAAVTIHVYKKETLASVEWVEVGPKDASGKPTGFKATVGRGDTEVSVPVKGVDMTSGFYKVVVVQ